MLVAGVIALTTATASPAANCWNMERVAAARIAEFNAAMMVTTLQCDLISVDIKSSYESFIVNYKTRLQSADDRLKRHFKDDGAGGEKSYHQFYTQIGNRYGAAKTDSARCALFAAVATELARSGSNDEVLDKYASALVPDPAITGQRCAQIASKP
jgi:hypothetical protein